MGNVSWVLNVNVSAVLADITGINKEVIKGFNGILPYILS